MKRKLEVMRAHRTSLVLFIIIALFGQVQVSLAQGGPEPVVVASNETGLSLSWTPPAYSLTELDVDGTTYSRIEMSGTSLTGHPGRPELPFYSSLVGLPASGGVHLRLVEVEREVVPLPHPPLPAPVPQPVSDSLSPPLAGPTTRRPDPAVYDANEFYPSNIAQLGPVEQVGRQRVARLILNPVRVNPVSRQMEIVRYLRVEVSFDEPGSAVESLSAQATTPFDRALAATLLNPQARGWAAGPAPLGTESFYSASTGRPVKVAVDQVGLYALTYEDLLQAGLPVQTLDPRILQLHHGWPRQEVAIWVDGQADGRFDPGDRLLFYAEPTFSRFTDHDVYFLTDGQTAGQRMASRPANPTGSPGTAWRTAEAEVNRFYEPHYPDHNGDHWFWDKLSRAEKQSEGYTLQLESPLLTGPNASLTVWLQGYTDPAQNPDHRVAVSVNGTPVGEQSWNGAQAVEATFSVPAALLKDGLNEVQLSLPGLAGVTVEGTWLDGLALTYPVNQGRDGQLKFQGETGQKFYTLSGWSTAALQLYDVTTPDQPSRLTGYQVTTSGATSTLTVGDAGTEKAVYLVVPEPHIKSPLSIEPAKLFDQPPGGADYIIITHPAFAGAVAPLAAHRSAQGLRVVTVDVEAIYDTFGPGRMDPAAIKNFLQGAYSTWTPPAPTYVLLVGDGSYDFKDYSGYQPQTFIPPYLAPVDPWWGETAADNRFVTVAGDDPLPDMLIGRLAVNSAEEVATVVDKIIQYETNPTPGGWNARHLFVSDIDDDGIFYAAADQSYSQVQAPFVGQRFYYGGGSDSYFYPDVGELRSTFLNSFNQGAGLVTFYGHSSWLQWATDGILRYYPPPYTGPDDLAAMRNQYRLPVVLEMTCFTGFFHLPSNPTLDESLLNLSGGGAAGVWGSTGLGVSTGHAALQRGFYRSLTVQGKTELGAAALAGKMELYGTGFHQDLLDTFTLFGDPALKMDLAIVPFSNHLYLPLVLR